MPTVKEVLQDLVKKGLLSARAMVQAQPMTAPVGELFSLPTKRLQGVAGVEAAFLQGDLIFAVAREFSEVDWEALVEAEDAILNQCPKIREVRVRAHQGRIIDDMFPGLIRRLF